MTLANAIKRKTHKERSQPSARKKYGLLEKHKDYVLRAKDFHRKERTVKALQRKAEERNPDEFYFAMEKARTKGGIHLANKTQANKYTQEELRLMKSQDVKYLQHKSRVEAEKIDRLKSNLHFIGAPAAPVPGRHLVFVDDERQARSFRPEEFFGTPRELLGRAFNRPRREQLEAGPPPAAPATLAKAEKRMHSAYRELVQRSARLDKLSGVASKMAYDKEVMGKGRKRKLQPSERNEPGQAPMFKWKRERSK